MNFVFIRHTTQHPSLKEAIVNLSDKTLDEALNSALRKRLSYAVAATVLPMQYILRGAENAVTSLLFELAEEVSQENVRILKGSSRPRDDLTGAERTSLRALRTNADPTFLLADKGNARVVLKTVDYNHMGGGFSLQSKDPNRPS
jgi:hypothetical protein